jgi:hypothetical protein
VTGGKTIPPAKAINAKTQEGRDGFFSQLGLEPNHTGFDSSVTLLLRRVVQSKKQ